MEHTHDFNQSIRISIRDKGKRIRWDECSRDDNNAVTASHCTALHPTLLFFLRPAPIDSTELYSTLPHCTYSSRVRSEAVYVQAAIDR